jgi:acetylornithine aminotransferase
MMPRVSDLASPLGRHLMRTYARAPVSFAKGAGARLWDIEGNEYLDAISGVAVTNLGHAHPAITAAIIEQAGLLLHTSNMFDITWQERLATRLCDLSGMEGAFFCNSGAEANETALKLARLHANRLGVQQAQVLVMDNSFHGRTIATLSATGNPAVHRGFEPLMSGFVRLPYNDIQAVLDAQASHPGIVAVLVESVQGEGGVRAASLDYMRSLRTLATEHNWLLMVDEVQTGMGRTGRWFGFQHAGISPDVMTLAKGLGNGVPIGACLARGAAAQLFSTGHHGSTFGGNPLACRVACSVIDVMERDHIPEQAAALGARLLSRLQIGLQGAGGVVDIRGHGLMVGIELASPCPGLVARALTVERLLVTVTREKTVRLLPPLICTEDEIDDIADRVVRLISSIATS